MRTATRLGAVILIAFASSTQAQGWEAVQAPTTTSLRGISVPQPNVVWVSGARGAVARSVDGGRSWTLVSVPGADSLDFRDVEAFDASTAYVLSIGNGAASRIYKTTDGGRNWGLQFTNPDTTAFYDCFAFWDERRGIAMSDPVDGRIRVLTTTDGGATWSVSPAASSPTALEGEAGFAASGTCVVTGDAGEAWIITGGGPRSRAHRTADYGASWQTSDITPIPAGAAPRGAFSAAVVGGENLVATGGNYEQPADTTGIVALSADGGRSWRAPTGTGPRGYRSGVAVASAERGDVLVAVGTSGTDYSLDGGDSWIPADALALNAVAFAADGSGWAVGPRGRVVRWRGGFPVRIRQRGKEGER